LDALSDEELESVLAHEIAHVRYWHLPFYVLFVLGYGVLMYALFTGTYLGLIGQAALLDLVLRDDGTVRSASYAVPVVLAAVCLLLYFRYLFGWFSRNFERQADGYAAAMMGGPAAIISSLDRIAGPDTAARTAPNWHHFSIQERIAFLERCRDNPGLIRRHTGKVMRMVALFMLVVAVAAGAALHFGQSPLHHTEMEVMRVALERRIAHDRNNPLLHFVLANILFEQQQYRQAEQVYRRVIELDPRMHEALNNLAWLYATADDDELFKPREALELAAAAASLAPQPHILDTLAEAYFVNGRFADAVSAIQAAIAMQPDDPDYYRGQLERFRKYIHRDRHDGGAAGQAL
jgi:predicted Zn-dependent protease